MKQSSVHQTQHLPILYSRSSCGFAADAKGKQNPEAQAWKWIHICIASPPTKPTQLLYPPILPSHYLQGSRRLSWTARHEFEYDIFILTTQKARPSPPPGEDEPEAGASSPVMRSVGGSWQLQGFSLMPPYPNPDSHP